VLITGKEGAVSKIAEKNAPLVVLIREKKKEKKERPSVLFRAQGKKSPVASRRPKEKKGEGRGKKCPTARRRGERKLSRSTARPAGTRAWATSKEKGKKRDGRASTKKTTEERIHAEKALRGGRSTRWNRGQSNSQRGGGKKKGGKKGAGAVKGVVTMARDGWEMKPPALGRKRKRKKGWRSRIDPGKNKENRPTEEKKKNQSADARRAVARRGAAGGKRGKKKKLYFIPGRKGVVVSLNQSVSDGIQQEKKKKKPPYTAEREGKKKD